MRLSKAHKDAIKEAILKPYNDNIDALMSQLRAKSYISIIANTPIEVKIVLFDDKLRNYINLACGVYISTSFLLELGYQYEQASSESFTILFEDNLQVPYANRTTILKQDDDFISILKAYIDARKKRDDMTFGLSCALGSIKTSKALENEFPEAFKEFEKIKNSQPKKENKTSNCDKIEQIRAELNSKK